MKYLILICLICTSNNLFASLNFKEFVEVKTAVAKAFLELRPNKNHSLVINKKVGDNPYYWFEQNMVHASYSGYEHEGKFFHHIFLFGGYIRLKNMTKDGLALTACHEIGHGIGGLPKKVTGSSTEGQSDYYATKDCLEVVFKYLKSEGHFTQSNYVSHFCSTYSGNFNFCLRSFTALESSMYFFETYTDKTYVDSFSSEIAQTVNTDPSFYPDSQCRVDTMIHGIIDIERPICWYPDGIERKL